jgi:outer membrane PBP1 activator LpoA protein
MGVDAYNIIGKLAELERNSSAYFPGETGDLSLDRNHRLQRRLTWAKFHSGIPRVMEDF